MRRKCVRHRKKERARGIERDRERERERERDSTCPLLIAIQHKAHCFVSSILLWFPEESMAKICTLLWHASKAHANMAATPQ